ncbi:MAG: HAD family hydrolase [Dehalococcoidales bacterium]|nr:HAD family hydrolase [Dehalococcoidales bacterium]
MKKPLGVIFDLGDTIIPIGKVDWIPIDKKLLDYAVNDTGISPKELQETANRLNRALEPARNDNMIEVDIIRFYRLLFESLGIKLSISYDEAAGICWDMAYDRATENGIYDVLDTLEKHGIQKGILSNGVFLGKILEGALEKIDMADRFSFVMSSADYGIRKPSPLIFEVAVKKMGYKPEEIWFVGDLPQYDVQGAIAGGLFPVWYNTRNDPSDHGHECLEIHSWYEFIDVIESL